jgi:quinolinate synthase
VHITEEMLRTARASHPRASILIHPEAPRACRHLADEVLSTGGMCRFVQEDTHQEYAIATEVGLIHTLRKQNPGKSFYPVDDSITCPNMRIGSVQSVLRVLEGTGGRRIAVPEETAEKARGSLERMLELSQP